MEVYDEGYEAYQDGFTRNANPFIKGSCDRQEWFEGWDDGNEWFAGGLPIE